MPLKHKSARARLEQVGQDLELSSQIGVGLLVETFKARKFLRNVEVPA